MEEEMTRKWESSQKRKRAKDGIQEEEGKEQTTEERHEERWEPRRKERQTRQGSESTIRVLFQDQGA